MSKIFDYLLTLLGIIKYYTFAKRFQFFDRGEVEIYQFEKLKILLVESQESVPYYKELFSRLNFNPKYDFNCLSDLNKIPVLSKDIVKKNRDLFINKYYLNKSLKFKTSGSSGVPLEVFVHPKQWIMEQAVIWRHWKWGGYNFRDSLAMVRSYVPENIDKLWKTNYITNFTLYSPFHLSDDNIYRYLESMIRNNVVILRGYPSSLLIISDYVLRTNCKIPKIKLILTASEVLNSNDRVKIEMAFNAKIFNHYGLAEQVVMMGECEKHEGLHNYDEYGYLELVDTDDPSVKKIVGTNLNNLTMPLIRYDTGDLAIVEKINCSCGRESILVKNIIGRSDLNIITKTGHKIPTVNFYTLFEHFAEVSRWQMVQKSFTLIKIILLTDNISISRLDELKGELGKRLSVDIEVEFLINEQFVMKNEGKINPFVSEIL
jgi:phenylacetate-CoA ligase